MQHSAHAAWTSHQGGKEGREGEDEIVCLLLCTYVCALCVRCIQTFRYAVSTYAYLVHLRECFLSTSCHLSLLDLSVLDCVF